MQIFLVGGAVRDQMLGRSVKDHDYLVVGSTEAEVIARLGGQRIGKAFPVILVPGMGEVALARRETKTGTGHSSFAVDFGPEVTLEQDLSRRDLTINAMALSEDKHLIDPFGGMRDIESRMLRHVGPAFVEDPLRIYRLARFASELGFTIADETMDMCRTVSEDEIAALSIERVRSEFLRAIAAPFPARFVSALRSMGHLGIHFPEIDALASVPAGPENHHGEGDALTHTLMVLIQAAALSGDVNIRLAALLHDLGKALTKPSLLPKHHGHEDAGIVPIKALCDRLKLSKQVRNACSLASAEHLNVHRFAALRHTRKVDIIVAADKTVLMSEGLAMVARADARGRIPAGSEQGPDLLCALAPVVRNAETGPIPEALQGKHIGLHIRARRAGAIQRYLKEKEVM